MAKGVRNTHHEYDEYLPVWQRCEDAVSGQRAVQSAGVRYLPMLTGEKLPDYQARVMRSDYFNATWRTIAGLSGMAFRKAVTTNLPAAIEPFLKNIDLAGMDMTTMAKLLVEDVLEVGRIGLLVDHPPMPENVVAMTVAIGEQLGHRPTLKIYDAQSIINWRYRTIGNTTVLAMVVLKEEAEVPGDSEFEWGCEDRYRVLDLDEAGFYRQRVFRINDQTKQDELVEGPVYPVMRGRKMTYIPFFILGVDGIQTECDEPPLIDLVDANIAHYQVNSDYRHGLHFTGLPTLFLSGIADEEPLYIGSARAITSPQPDAKGEYLEFSGQGLGAVEKALASLERRMAVLGARMIADETKQVETLGATQIKRAGENSILASAVIAVSDVIERALRVMAEWVGASGEVVYQINREFTPVAMDAQQLTALVSAWQAGAVSEAELFDVLKRGDVIDGEKSLEEHQSEIDVSVTMPRPANDAQQVAA